MDNVNKTLYIPLYGKAFVSRKGCILTDKKAEEIWAAEGFVLKGKSASKWLAYYMGIRSAVFDDWLRKKMSSQEDSIVIHIGCGMDSRVERVGIGNHDWYDIDFPEVIQERKKYYRENEKRYLQRKQEKAQKFLFWLASFGKMRYTILQLVWGVCGLNGGKS